MTINAKFCFFGLYRLKFAFDPDENGNHAIRSIIGEMLDRGRAEPHLTFREKDGWWLHFTAGRDKAKNGGAEPDRHGLGTLTDEVAEGFKAWGENFLPKFVSLHQPADLKALDAAGMMIVGVPFDRVYTWMLDKARRGPTLDINNESVGELLDMILDTEIRPEKLIGVEPNVWLRAVALKVVDDETELLPVSYYPEGYELPSDREGEPAHEALKPGWYTHAKRLINDPEEIAPVIAPAAVDQAGATLRDCVARYPRKGRVADPEYPPSWVIELLLFFNPELRNLWFAAVIAANAERRSSAPEE